MSFIFNLSLKFEFKMSITFSGFYLLKLLPRCIHLFWHCKDLNQGLVPTSNLRNDSLCTQHFVDFSVKCKFLFNVKLIKKLKSSVNIILCSHFLKPTISVIQDCCIISLIFSAFSGLLWFCHIIVKICIGATPLFIWNSCL